MQENHTHNKWADFKEDLSDDQINENLRDASHLEGLPPQDHKTPEEITRLENELDQANLLAQSNKNDYLRAMAELDNARRMNARELEKAHKYGLEKLIRELLPAIDSLEKSLEHATAADENLKKGVQMTLDLFLGALRKHEVIAMNPLGQIFNPAQEEAVSTVATEQHPPNTVIEVLQKAYLLHDRVIRPALVVVSKG